MDQKPITTDGDDSPPGRRRRVRAHRDGLTSMAREHVREGSTHPAVPPSVVSVYPNIFSPLPRPIGFVTTTSTSVTVSLGTNNTSEPHLGRVYKGGSPAGEEVPINFLFGSFSFTTLPITTPLAVGDVLTIRVYGDPDVVSPDEVEIDVK